MLSRKPFGRYAGVVHSGQAAQGIGLGVIQGLPRTSRAHPPCRR